jgi:hypothetical protein
MPKTFSIAGCILVGILYILTLASNIYVLYKCSVTDPGIIPAIKENRINFKKHYCNIHI